MKYFQGSFFIIFQAAMSFELMQSFTEETCTRKSFFIFRIDDHFDEKILNGTVISPSFLSISERKLVLTDLYSIPPVFNRFSSLSFYENKMMTLSSNGIVIYEIISPYNMNIYYRPPIVQVYRDSSLSYYTYISDGRIFAVYNMFFFQVFAIEEIYPEKIVERNHHEEILKLLVIKLKIVVVGRHSISIYTLIDTELGYYSTETVSYSSFQLDSLKIVDTYSTGNALYLLDSSIGILKFSIFPTAFLMVFPYKGYKLSGFDNTLIVDGVLEINTLTNSTKTYSTLPKCAFLSIDSDFIYCATKSQLYVTSRVMNLTESFTKPGILFFSIHEGVVFFNLNHSLQISKVDYGKVYIQGTVPDEVNDYPVLFSVCSFSSKCINETFILAVQYSLANVIIFLLLSFISVFGMIFLCSFICRIIAREPEPETAVQKTPEVMQSTERYISSDRELISK